MNYYEKYQNDEMFKEEVDLKNKLFKRIDFLTKVIDQFPTNMIDEAYKKTTDYFKSQNIKL